MLRHSRMQTLGSPAANFSLPDPSGGVHSLRDFDDAHALLVAFLCNHCPFVQHILGGFVEYARDYESRGVAVVAISSNDIESHPDDSPKHMAEVAGQIRFYISVSLRRIPAGGARLRGDLHTGLLPV